MMKAPVRIFTPRQHIHMMDEILFSLDGSHLSIVGSELSELPSFADKKYKGLPLVNFVTSVDASLNNLESIDRIQEFKNIKKLFFDYNNLESDAFGNFNTMPTLETLWINSNNISDVKHFIEKIASVFPNLTCLSFLKNPNCPDPFIDENKDIYQSHRYFVLFRLRKLKSLDNFAVSENEYDFLLNHSPSDFESIKYSKSINFLSLSAKSSKELTIVKQGELTIFNEKYDYNPWNPTCVRVGEGKLIIFRDHCYSHLESVISLYGYQVQLVDSPELLARAPPNTEIIRFTHNSKPTLCFISDKLEATEWVESIVGETHEKLMSTNWDEIQNERSQMLSLAKELNEKAAEIHLKRTFDQSYNLDPNEIKLISMLGAGSFGTVYKAIIREKPFAVKVLQNQNLTPEALDDFCNEVDIISKIHHPNIILFMGACLNPLMIVTELMVGGDLESLLLDSSVNLSFLRRLRMAKDAALGMAWLHLSNPMILHRDVKTKNFLVDENLRVVVADFGFSESLKQGSFTYDENGSYKGTIYCTAPEILKNVAFNEKSDVYSFAIVLWQLFTRKALDPEYDLIKSDNPEKTILSSIVFGNYRPQIPINCPPGYKKLIEDCWNTTQSKRPSFTEILEILEEEIYNEAIPNTEARKFWKNLFPKKDKVKWDLFLEQFSTVVNINNNTEKAILKSLISDNEISNNRFGGVSIEDFGCFISYFGPLETDMMKRVRALAAEKWFFANTSIDSAFNLLNGQPSGTFLIRYSEYKNGDFIASYVSKDGLIVHQDIIRNVKNKTYQFSSSKPEYSSLVELVSNQACLKLPSAGSPFNIIFSRAFSKFNKKDTNNYSELTSKRDYFRSRKSYC